MAGADSRTADVDDEIRGSTTVKTRVNSRAEVTFADETVARLGANTLLRFNQGARSMELGEGAILLRVRRGTGGAKIETPAVTATITRTTVLFDFHDKTLFKFMVLEGVARLSSNGVRGRSVRVHAGEILVGEPGDPLGRPVAINLAEVMKTSRLVSEFRPLGSEPLIAKEIRKQRKRSRGGALINTGPGSELDQSAQDTIERRATAFPTAPTGGDKPPQARP
ncbi:MAG: FecR domain-containing protein [Chthoniobacterales bacterium]